MVASAAFAYALRPPEPGRGPSCSELRRYWKEVGTLAACTVVNLGCNNASLVYIGLFLNQAHPRARPASRTHAPARRSPLTFKSPFGPLARPEALSGGAGAAAHARPRLHNCRAQIIKSMGPLLVMGWSFVLLRKRCAADGFLDPHDEDTVTVSSYATPRPFPPAPRYAPALVLAVSVAAAAAAMAVPYSRPSFSLLGLLLVCISAAAGSLKGVVAELLLSSGGGGGGGGAAGGEAARGRPQLAPTVVVFYESSVAAVLMAAAWLANASEREASLRYLAAEPQWAVLILALGPTPG